MADRTRLLDSQAVWTLGSDGPVVTIDEGDKDSGTWAGRRFLSVHDKRSFELGFWCGTCPFLFERLSGATETLSIDALQDLLNDGISDVDEAVVKGFSALLPKGRYQPLLLEIEPTLVYPMSPGDYFAEDQVATWGINPFWGLPDNPRTPYYRTDTRSIDDQNRLFEFVVPMVPPTWNDQDRVEFHAKRLEISDEPTCVALGLLDVRQPAVSSATQDGLTHWTLTHFLLDGHHKIEAAAKAGARLRLLTLISIDQSLAEPSQVERLATIFNSTS